jgi:Fe-S oxidoreductase
MHGIAPLKEGRELIDQEGGDSSKLCYQCSLCDVLCPWNHVTNFTIRKQIRQAHLGLTEIEGEELWQCTTCGRCVERCPRGVQIIDIVRSSRRIATEYNLFPQSLRTVRGSLSGEGNPWGSMREKRGDWAKDLSLEPFTEDKEILYFPCCTQCYDSRNVQVSIATAEILKKAGIQFGIIDTDTVCCGESIRQAGEEDVYKYLTRTNIKTFIDNGVKRILVTSPHCYHTFKNEYREFKVDFEVIHISQYLHELIDTGRLQFTKEYPKKVTYHDPCYLGRHNGIYTQPREILKAIPGLELVEMEYSWENSFCCGGGGGRIWMDTPKGERLSDLRLQQAIETGSTVLATLCPYCIINFEDSRLDLGENIIEIKDVVEIVHAAL